MVTTNPSSYQSQKYGYYSAGGFSVRIPHRAENLMSVSLPQIKTGCGGIDTFWGGISFMNADYLVKKAEGVLKNAPYIVFSIGLKSLSSLFGDTIEAVQSITDQLNQLQLDECAAAKGTVSLLSGGSSGLTEEWDRLTTNADNLRKGVARDWHKLKMKVDNNPVEEKNKSAAGVIKDPKVLKFISGSGHVLHVLADDSIRRLTLAEAEAMRALVGDIYFNNTGKDATTGGKLDGGIVRFVDGCESTMTLKSYINAKTPYQVAGQTVCGQSTLSIYERASDSLEEIKNALIGASDITKPYDTGIVAFINKTDLPIFAYMSSASAAGRNYLDSTVEALVPVVAAGYAYGSLKNLSNSVRSVITELESDLGNQAAYTEKLLNALKDYNRVIRERMKDFESEYDLEVQRLNSVFALVRQFEETNRNIYEIRNAALLNKESRRK